MLVALCLHMHEACPVMSWYSACTCMRPAVSAYMLTPWQGWFAIQTRLVLEQPCQDTKALEICLHCQTSYTSVQQASAPWLTHALAAELCHCTCCTSYAGRRCKTRLGFCTRHVTMPHSAGHRQCLPYPPHLGWGCRSVEETCP